MDEVKGEIREMCKDLALLKPLDMGAYLGM